jgi:glycerol-3-phosphate acyltransferase PlsY
VFSFLLLVIPAYFIGTIPFSVWVARCAGFDLYTSGSKNPGASNVIRVAGWKWGVLAMMLDILKGFFPTFLSSYFVDNFINAQSARIVTFLVAIAAICGHVFPLFRKGGKGVATGGGAALALFPIPGIVAIALWALLMKLIKKPVIASMFAIGVLTIFVAFTSKYFWEFVLVFGLYILIAIRHIPNIIRMIKKTENQIKNTK